MPVIGITFNVVLIRAAQGRAEGWKETVTERRPVSEMQFHHSAPVDIDWPMAAVGEQFLTIIRCGKRWSADGTTSVKLYSLVPLEWPGPFRKKHEVQ